jgi:hypothetical protein
MAKTELMTKTTTAFGPLDTTSILRPARYECPDCRRRGGEASILERCPSGKFDFFRCRLCAGVWFHEKCVDDALKAAGLNTWTPPKGKLPEPLPDSVWACPCCKGTLVNVHDRRGSGATVRRCLICYGGWIEYPDLLKACDASADVLSRVGRFVRNLLPGRRQSA